MVHTPNKDHTSFQLFLLIRCKLSLQIGSIKLRLVDKEDQVNSPVAHAGLIKLQACHAVHQALKGSPTKASAPKTLQEDLNLLVDLQALALVVPLLLVAHLLMLLLLLDQVKGTSSPHKSATRKHNRCRLSKRPSHHNLVPPWPLLILSQPYTLLDKSPSPHPCWRKQLLRNKNRCSENACSL